MVRLNEIRASEAAVAVPAHVDAGLFEEAFEGDHHRTRIEAQLSLDGNRESLSEKVLNEQ